MNTMHLMIAILGTGISLAGLIIGLIIWLRADMKDLRNDMKGMETGLRTDMKHMESGLRADMQTMESGLRTDMKDMEARLSAVEHSQAKLEGLMEGLRAAIVARSTS